LILRWLRLLMLCPLLSHRQSHDNPPIRALTRQHKHARRHLFHRSRMCDRYKALRPLSRLPRFKNRGRQPSRLRALRVSLPKKEQTPRHRPHRPARQPRAPSLNRCRNSPTIYVTRRIKPSRPPASPFTLTAQSMSNSSSRPPTRVSTRSCSKRSVNGDSFRRCKLDIRSKADRTSVCISM
jgi:hypothetical protein